ncbi:MAG: efflux RND transporter periplasmic adaptor subunit [Bacteroidota bacterium]
MTKHFYSSIFLLSIIAVIHSSCGKKVETGPPSNLPVPVANPLKETIVDWDEFIGRFEASERVEIRSRVSGYIDEIRFEDGQNVEEGQVLFVIDQRPFRLAVKQAEADLLQAESQKLRAESDYQRVASITDTRAVSREEVEQRQQSARVAQAQYESARARLDLARLELNYTEVKAPISGRVSEDFVNAGNFISGGSANSTLLTTIVKLDPIFFYFEGSEADFLRYQQLARTGVRKSSRTEPNPVMAKLLNETSYVRRGKMNFVDNELDENTGTIQARAVFENSEQELESGMFGRVRLLGEGEIETILIPDDVISTNQSRKVVYVLSDSNSVSIRPVEIGELYNEKYRIVKSGLSESDRVIIGNLLKVRPGMKVEPELREIEFEIDSTTIL